MNKFNPRAGRTTVQAIAAALALAIPPLEAASSAPASADVVMMDAVKVPAGYDAFVPSWMVDAQPPRLVLQVADQIRLRQPVVKWLVRPDLGLKHGDHIVAVNGKRVNDPGFLELWRSAQQEGQTLALEVQADGTGRSRKIEYAVKLLRPPAPPAKPAPAAAKKKK